MYSNPDLNNWEPLQPGLLELGDLKYLWMWMRVNFSEIALNDVEENEFKL